MPDDRYALTQKADTGAASIPASTAASAAVHGFSIALTAHAIGTAQALRTDESVGGVAALGMGLNPVATAFLLPVLVWLARSR